MDGKPFEREKFAECSISALCNYLESLLVLGMSEFVSTYIADPLFRVVGDLEDFAKKSVNIACAYCATL